MYLMVVFRICTEFLLVLNMLKHKKENFEISLFLICRTLIDGRLDYSPVTRVVLTNLIDFRLINLFANFSDYFFQNR